MLMHASCYPNRLNDLLNGLTLGGRYIVGHCAYAGEDRFRLFIDDSISCGEHGDCPPFQKMVKLSTKSFFHRRILSSSKMLYL